MSATLTSPALEKFDALSWPIRTVENWRFGSWKEANLSGIELLGAGASADLPSEIEGATRFVFQNAELVSGSHGSVTFLGESFGPESRLGSPKLAALHSAKSDHGISITASGEETIEIIHLVTGEGLLLPSLVINAEAGAKLRVIQRFISTDDAAAVVLTAVDVNLGEKADVKYLVTQELNLASKFIRIADSCLQAGADARQAVIHTGSKWVREETYSTVDGSDGQSHILSVALPDTGQEFDQRTFQHHGGRDTYSNLLFKNTLFGKGKTIFSGLIFVDEGAHGTDAYQTCRNLMMTDDCEAHSMPGLEINADDVKCSHGSTSARVSEEEIFYLMARGIQPKLARNLVAKGFSAEAVEKLEDETLEALAMEVVERKFLAVE
ncbi:SufD family Fe-S cluster assembly protein [Akkermansiaceae bacterium]|nr:SufD family Fe-S cluster assembly protein [Akkermansiaceae bacterium]MDB4262467.1 SufD family Fe-S cluster assembly protein [bacterium]MDA7862228.1 SufD family Fe-S cluster assembly protein [Akkermansiaceae bacterium]MDA8960274.1 SufD family Fe-S cluster assembly protein [Akkermansiaceae bacterium]MDB4142648.1 SufD family Fe-S cluster assembly protein [Akkermansiaceae bacterium]